MRATSIVFHQTLTWLLVGCWLFGSTAATAAPSTDDCPVAAEQGGVLFPVDKLNASTRCQIGAVVNGYTSAGLIGPVQTPVTPQLYKYLLDQPSLIASLLERFSLAAYQFRPEGPNRFWFNDGEGIQGILTLLYQDRTNRIYYLDGYYEGSIFPRLYAKAAVFMKIVPVTVSDGASAAQMWLVSYIQLDDSLMAGLIRMLRPLVSDAMTRKLTRGFGITNQLAALIANDPNRVAQEAALIPGLPPESLQSFRSAIESVTSRPSAPLPMHASP